MKNYEMHYRLDKTQAQKMHIILNIYSRVIQSDVASLKCQGLYLSLFLELFLF